MSKEDHSPAAGLARVGLACLEWPYRVVIASRNACFDSGIRRAIGLERPTISVGNITAGGTGKTPMVIELAGRLGRRGVLPCVLLRGYKAASVGESDEAAVLAEALGDTAVVEADADRVAAAKRVLGCEPGVGVFLLDDGFQHRKVKRDLDVVLIDATQPFGYGRVLPRGLLREPVTALRRAHAVVVTRSDLADPTQLTRLDERIEQITGQRPVAHTAHRWSGFVDPRGSHTELPALSGARVVSACGIGNPDAFERMLRQHVREVIRVQRFDDHHRYTRADLETLFAHAQSHDADAVVTTHKDAVKWRALLDGVDPGVSVFFPVLGVSFLDGEERVDSLLHSVAVK